MRRLRYELDCVDTNETNHFQPFTDEFPCASIYLLLAPDILHQLIKGTFKDHLVDWVMKYLEFTHGKAGAKEILTNIDQQ